MQCKDDDDKVITQVTCDDGIQNGDEEGIDCGGSVCTPCSDSTINFDGIFVQEDIIGRPGVNTIFSGSNSMKNDFKAPNVPDAFYSLADFKFTSNQDRVWIETTGDISVIQKAIVVFFDNLYATDHSMKVNTDQRMETVSMPFYGQGWFASLWSSITRLYPEKVIYEIVLEKGEHNNRIGLRYKIQKRWHVSRQFISFYHRD